MRTMWAALQDRTQYRHTSDGALVKWIVRHAGWLIPRSEATMKSLCAVDEVGPCRGKLNLCLLIFENLCANVWQRQ